jgi:hypothetical protein
VIDDDEAGSGFFDFKAQLLHFAFAEERGRAWLRNGDDARSGDFEIDGFSEAGRFGEAILRGVGDDGCAAAVARAVLGAAVFQNRNDDERAAGRDAQKLMTRLLGAGPFESLILGRLIDGGCRFSLREVSAFVAAFAVHEVHGRTGHDGRDGMLIDELGVAVTA